MIGVQLRTVLHVAIGKAPLGTAYSRHWTCEEGSLRRMLRLICGAVFETAPHTKRLYLLHDSYPPVEMALQSGALPCAAVCASVGRPISAREQRRT